MNLNITRGQSMIIMHKLTQEKYKFIGGSCKIKGDDVFVTLVVNYESQSLNILPWKGEVFKFDHPFSDVNDELFEAWKVIGDLIKEATDFGQQKLRDYMISHTNKIDENNNNTFQTRSDV